MKVVIELELEQHTLEDLDLEDAPMEVQRDVILPRIKSITVNGKVPEKHSGYPEDNNYYDIFEVLGIDHEEYSIYIIEGM